MALLEVKGLSKAFGGVLAVQDVGFAVEAGLVYSVIGPNGAGKTTTINMVLGVLAPSTGSVSIAGCDVNKHRTKALARTNFAAVYAPLPGNLTVLQNLRFFGLLYCIASLKQRIAELLREFDLEHLRDTRCGLLSSGEQTRVALAKAMLNRPQLLLLDEPTRGIDVGTKAEIYRLMDALAAQGKAVLFVSSYLPELLAVCDRIGVMARGRLRQIRAVGDWTEHEIMSVAVAADLPESARSFSGPRGEA